MNTCEERKCKFWSGKNCTDEEDYISAKNFEPMCRYNSDAFLRESEPRRESLGVKEIENIIADSKLYQGFQCDNYLIRLGLKKRLAKAIKEAL